MDSPFSVHCYCYCSDSVSSSLLLLTTNSERHSNSRSGFQRAFQRVNDFNGLIEALPQGFLLPTTACPAPNVWTLQLLASLWFSIVTHFLPAVTPALCNRNEMQNWDREISRKRFVSLSLSLSFRSHLMLSASAGFSDPRSFPAATVFLCTLSPSTFSFLSVQWSSFLFSSFFSSPELLFHDLTSSLCSSTSTRTPLKERWGKSSRNRFGVSSPAPQMLIFDHQLGLGKLCLSESYVVYNLRANQVQRLNFTHCSPDPLSFPFFL